MERDLIAVAVLLHLLATGLQALPSAGAGLDRRQWRDPTVQAELHSWREGLARVGVAFSEEEFEDTLYALARGVEDVRRTALAPFDPYLRHSGSWQSWKMFVAPHRHPARLVVRVGSARGEVWYRRGEVAHPSLAALDHDRLRGVMFRMAWPSYHRHAKRFAEAVARRVRAADPEVSRVYVGFERRATPRPEAVLAGEEVPWVPDRPYIVTFTDDGEPHVRGGR